MKTILLIIAMLTTACQTVPKTITFEGQCTMDDQCKPDHQCRRTPIHGVGSCQPVGIQASDWLSTTL